MNPGQNAQQFKNPKWVTQYPMLRRYSVQFLQSNYSMELICWYPMLFMVRLLDQSFDVVNLYVERNGDPQEWQRHFQMRGWNRKGVSDVNKFCADSAVVGKCSPV